MPGETRGLRLGRVSGVPVIVAPSAWILIAVVAVVFAPSFSGYVRGTGQLVIVVLVFALLLSASVALHEVCHAVTAQRLHIPAGEIVITGWGGHTTMERMPRPGAQALIAVAGPAANAIIGLAFFVLFTLARQGHWPGVVQAIVLSAAWSNWFVAAFNLLPGLPLDGGQVLEAIVWGITRERLKGTLVAGWIGRLVAIGVGLWAIVLPFFRRGQVDLYQAMWALLIGSYLWSGATQAIRAARHAETLDGLDPLAMGHEVVPMPPTATLADADAALARRPGAVVLLLDAQGRPAGVVDPQTAASVPPGSRAHAQLSSVAVRLPDQAAVPASLRGQALAHALGQVARSTNWVAVIADDGRVARLLKVTDVIAALR